MKIRVNKSTAIITGVILFLTAAVIMLGILNYEYMTARRELLRGYGTFLVTVVSENYTHVVSMDDVLTIGYMPVSAIYRGESRNFTGVPLASIFEHLGVDCSGADAVVVTSLDGLRTAISIADAMDDTNTFIIFEEDGQPLGTMEDGGVGPYRLIVARDPFPNRWARHLMEITVQ